MITFYCQNVWNHNPTGYRNKIIRNIIREEGADVCAFQECGPETIRVGADALPVLLSDEYCEVLPELCDSNFTPVFYKKGKFNLLDSGYFLYTGLNDVNSKSVTWAYLEEITTGNRAVFASTHFWWKEEGEINNLQRIENARQLKAFCDEITEKYNVPVIIGGDFNNGKNADAGDAPYRAMIEMGFCDTRLFAKKTTQSYTHHEYPEELCDGSYRNGPMPVRNLDNIFVCGKPLTELLEFDVLTSQAALDSSDHCPLVARLEL